MISNHKTNQHLPLVVYDLEHEHPILFILNITMQKYDSIKPMKKKAAQGFT